VKPIALNMVAGIARDPQTAGLPISGIGGIGNWRDAAEFMALGAGCVQVCTAAMLHGFRIVENEGWPVALDGREGLQEHQRLPGKAVPNTTDWKYLDMNYQVIAQINQDDCIKCGRCYVACEDTSHQSINQLIDAATGAYEVNKEECVGCNLCEITCPVQGCITMVPQNTPASHT
jgi:dihydropyrimidine dehydrogenase (NAD+) subunit PreA